MYLTNINNIKINDELQIDDYDDLLRQAHDIRNKYLKEPVDFGNEKQAKKDKANLNHLDKALNEHRLDKARAYLAKVDSFKSSVDDLRAPIKQASNHLKTQIDDCENQLKEARKKKVKDVVHKMSKGHGIDDISIQSSWITKSATKSSGEPNFKTLKAINQAIEFEQARQQQVDSDVGKIRSEATKLMMEPDGWITSYLSSNDDNALDNVLGSMKQHHDEAIKQREAKKQATQVVKDKVVNTTTGEFEKLTKVDFHVEGKQSDIEKLKHYANKLGLTLKENH